MRSGATSEADSAELVVESFDDVLVYAGVVRHVAEMGAYEARAAACTGEQVFLAAVGNAGVGRDVQSYRA